MANITREYETNKVIKMNRMFKNNKAVKIPYQEFTPTSTYTSGKNLQSYNLYLS